MTVTTGDIVRATVNLILPGPNIAQNVYHYLAGAGVAESETNVINTLSFLINSTYVNIDSLLANTITPGEIAFAVSNDNGATYSDIGTGAFTTFAPSSVNDMLPHGAAAVCRFAGVGTGRQGRKFISGITEAHQDESTLTAGAVTGLVFFALAVTSNATVAGGQLLAGWQRSNPLGFIQYSGSVFVNTVMGYQRRRKPGVGI